jgi:hypothetical protein
MINYFSSSEIYNRNQYKKTQLNTMITDITAATRHPEDPRP